jgi:hypothetical protein
MPLPETIRVKLSSEEAGAISMTAVLTREMPLADLIELMLDLTGKDAARIRELLLRGTLVSGASRYRWSGWDAGLENVEAALASFPDAEPVRAFDAARCAHVILRGPTLKLDVAREALAKKRLLGRRGFWDELLELVAETGPEYSGYSYRERADRYCLTLSPAWAERLRRNAGLLRYSALETQLRLGAVAALEFFVPRDPVRPAV